MIEEEVDGGDSDAGGDQGEDEAGGPEIVIHRLPPLHVRSL
jgi:hypothetical protein